VTLDDPFARLIPWYAAGTLGAEESAQVEAHLSSCDACRDYLAIARGFRRLGRQASLESFFDHVQSQRLVEFAEDPAGLEEEARRFITTHIQSCRVCAEALEILEDLGRAPALGRPAAALDRPGATLDTGPPPFHRRAWQACIDVWRRLSRTLLHPVPALAYLTALVIAFSVLPLRTPGPETGSQPPVVEPGPPPPTGVPARPPVSFVPPAFDLPGEVVFRSGGQPPAPAKLPLRAGAEAVALTLVPDLDKEDLQDAAAAFRVEILQEGRPVFEADMRAADFDRRGRLTLLLDPAAVSTSVPCRVRLLLVKPGDSRDGEELYRRTFLLVPEAAPPR
jgi:hypothetical protein